MAEKELRFYKNIARQKMAYAGHVLRGSSGLNALLIMECKISGVKARGRPRRAWTDDLKDWTELRNYSELKRMQRTGQFGTPWLVNLLLKKKTQEEEEEEEEKKKKKKKGSQGLNKLFTSGDNVKVTRRRILVNYS